MRNRQCLIIIFPLKLLSGRKSRPPTRNTAVAASLLFARAHTKAERAPLRHGRARVEQQANEAALTPALAKVCVEQTVLEEAETALAVCARDQ
jgi:hypothetical protein